MWHPQRRTVIPSSFRECNHFTTEPGELSRGSDAGSGRRGDQGRGTAPYGPDSATRRENPREWQRSDDTRRPTCSGAWRPQGVCERSAGAPVRSGVAAETVVAARSAVGALEYDGAATGRSDSLLVLDYARDVPRSAQRAASCLVRT